MPSLTKAKPCPATEATHHSETAKKYYPSKMHKAKNSVTKNTTSIRYSKVKDGAPDV